MGAAVTKRRGARGVLVVTAVLVSAVLFAGSGVVGAIGGRAAVTPRPRLSVRPVTGLADLQQVSVTGAHFKPNALVGTAECKPGAVGPNGCDLATVVFVTAKDTGSFTFSRPVRRIIHVGGATIDCAALGACILGAANLANFAQGAVSPIVFDPAIPPVRPGIRVSVSTDLVDHQLVAVTGKGFMPSSSAGVLQCVAQPTTTFFESCEYTSGRYAKVADDGTFTVKSFAVQRIISIYTKTGSRNFDCARAVGACVLRSTGGDFGSPPVSTPLGFDPAVPRVVPKLTARPSDGLKDHQLVTVVGTGFLPGSEVSVLQCVAVSTVPFPGCDYSGSQSVTAGFQGRFVVSFPVRRVISAYAPGGVVGVDCAEGVGTCVLSATGGWTQKAATIPLGFNPAVPSVIPRIVPTPGSGLHDNQHIAVAGEGFAPFRPIRLIECSAEAEAEADLSYCDYTTAQTVLALGDGRFDTTMAVHAVIGGQGGLELCTTRAGACVLAAVPNLDDYGGGSGSTTATTAPPAGSGAALPGPDALRAAAGATLPGVAFAPLAFGA